VNTGRVLDLNPPAHTEERHNDLKSRVLQVLRQNLVVEMLIVETFLETDNISQAERYWQVKRGCLWEKGGNRRQEEVAVQ